MCARDRGAWFREVASVSNTSGPGVCLGGWVGGGEWKKGGGGRRGEEREGRMGEVGWVEWGKEYIMNLTATLVHCHKIIL